MVSDRINLIKDYGVAKPEWCQDDPVSWYGREPFHEEWIRNDDDPYVIRLSRSQAAWHKAFIPEIIPGQLLVCNRLPSTVVSYRTGCFSWDIQLDKRVSEAYPETKPIYEYWKKWLNEREKPEKIPECNIEGFQDYSWIVGIGSHSTQDYGILIEGGLNGLRDFVFESSKNHPQSSDWYKALLISIDGVAEYIKTHSEALIKASESCRDKSQAEEWYKMASNCKYLSEGGAPRTFHEALQLFWFVFRLLGHDSPGRIDQYLMPPLKRDIDRGLSLKKAQELTDCLFLALHRYTCYGATIGGQYADGSDATNQMTWLCLSSIKRLKLLSPRTALRWHVNIPKELLLEASQSIASGATFPTIVNDEVVVPAMIRRGASVEHARDYTFCGCGQVTPMGRAYGSYEDIIINGVKPFMLALNNGIDKKTNIRIGPATGNADAFESYEAFEEAVCTHMEHIILHSIRQTNAIKEWGAKHLKDPVRSLLTHSCVKKGMDWREGGADYHEGMVDVVGYATLIDSLNSVRELIFEKKLLTFGELIKILDSDWENNESLRMFCINKIEKFGNDKDEADNTAVRVMDRLNKFLFSKKTFKGGPWGIDVIGWSAAVQMGMEMGATPDGRKKGEPIADSGGPAQGRDNKGITSVFHSMSKLPLNETHGPIALSVRISKTSINDTDGPSKLMNLIESYMKMGGQHIQITVADSEILKAAQENPEEYKDLIVRVGGFSAYFTQLEKCYQDDMISRTENRL